MGNSVSWADDTLTVSLNHFNAQAQRALAATMAYHAPRAEAYAKKNAPWRDRTSNARNGLFAVPRVSPPKYQIIVGHSVPYGVWLEIRWSGRYQIIRPTVENEGAEVMRTVSKLFDKIMGG